MAKKPSVGRQKIKMAKIEIKNHLQVTFSKRRSGLFKKASELCTLCGVEIAIIVFSPAGKAFSFGHPNVETIVDRLLARSASPNHNVFQLAEAHGESSFCELNLMLSRILDELEIERKKGEILENTRKASHSQHWWESPVDELRLNEAEKLKDAMEDLKRNVTNHVSNLMSIEVNRLLFSISDHNDIEPTLVLASSDSELNSNFGLCHEFF